MKEKYRAFKEWRKNPRYNALFQLLCWFLFFATLYLLASIGVFSPKYTSSSSTGSKENKMTTDSIENYINMSSFEYKYSISYDDKIITIEGIVYGDKNYFMIGEQQYYDDGILYLVDEENKLLISNPDIELPVSLSEIDRASIYLWLNEGDVYETISYNDGSTITTYIYSPTDEYEIKIRATEEEYLINTIDIDLLELLQTKDLSYNTFDINITYTNINNISSYEKNYSEYEIDIEIEEDNEELVEEEVQ